MVQYKLSIPQLVAMAFSLASCKNNCFCQAAGKKGKGGVRGNGGGGQDDGDANQSQVIQNLLDHRDDIIRTYTNTPTGIKATTWSLEDNVSGWLKTHVRQMKELMDSDSGVIRQWDELFQKAFELRDHHDMNVNYTANGVEVEQNGDNECAVAILQAHAKVVSLFIERGRAETRLNHEVPEICEGIEN
jgi:hypothetical protein